MSYKKSLSKATRVQASRSALAIGLTVCAALTQPFGDDRKLKYSPYLKPRVVNGVRCLAVDLKLKVVNPEGYAQLMHFADENQLNVLDSSGNSIPVPH